MSAEHIEVSHWTLGGYYGVIIRAGRHNSERVVPCAGPDWAFDRTWRDRRIEVTVSPTGRSARVWVDGVEIPKAKQGSAT